MLPGVSRLVPLHSLDSLHGSPSGCVPAWRVPFCALHCPGMTSTPSSPHTPQSSRLNIFQSRASTPQAVSHLLALSEGSVTPIRTGTQSPHSGSVPLLHLAGNSDVLSFPSAAMSPHGFPTGAPTPLGGNACHNCLIPCLRPSWNILFGSPLHTHGACSTVGLEEYLVHLHFASEMQRLINLPGLEVEAQVHKTRDFSIQLWMHRACKAKPGPQAPA